MRSSLTAEEHRRLSDGPARPAEQVSAVELPGDLRSDHRAQLVDDLPVAVHEFHFAYERLGRRREGAGHIAVVRVQPADDLAPRSAETNVERGRLSTRGTSSMTRMCGRRAYSSAPPPFRLSSRPRRRCARSRVLLSDHRLERVGEKASLIQAGRDDGDRRRAHDRAPFAGPPAGRPPGPGLRYQPSQPRRIDESKRIPSGGEVMAHGHELLNGLRRTRRRRLDALARRDGLCARDTTLRA